MSKINEVRERLQRACIAGMDAEYVDDVSALLDDHARLNELLGNSEQLPPAPAADPEDVRIVRIIAEKIDEGRLDHPGFYKNGRLSAALRNLLTLIDGQAGGQSHPDTDRFNFIEGECLAVEAVSVRASEDDADVAWVISQHHMGRGQVVLHRSHDDNLRRAIDAVMQPAKGEGE